MKRLLVILGLLGLFIVPSYCQNLAKSIDRLLAREVLVLKNTTNETADSSYVVFDMGDFRHFALDINLSGGVTCYVFATLDETLSDTDETEWANYGSYMFSADSIVDVHVLKFEPEFFSPTKVMLKFVNSDNTNSNSVILSKYN